jgi:hypothetical protein
MLRLKPKVMRKKRMRKKKRKRTKNRRMIENKGEEYESKNRTKRMVVADTIDQNAVLEQLASLM